LAQSLDSAYHDNAEILAELQHYAEAYPDWVALDSIGHSAEYGLPIWCVKISDNPRNIEPEAALLFVGQVHAEEVTGIEIALEIMKQMLDNMNDNAMRQRLEGLEIYIIPTANPEGHEVVTSGVDLAYRKNCRDNVGDGVLRIQEGEGWDTSGVDINRNFGTQWDRGDTLYRPEETFRYNAYRGSAPFSEPESRALRDLALSRPFLYSIVYHSSRSDNSTELFIAPWFWRENGIIKRPPDYLAINALGERVAGMLPGMRDRNSHYRPVQSMQRKGQLQDWFYVETGCIQYMAEVAADVQPTSDSMRMVVADNLPAVWYMMDLALGLEGLEGFGTLTVIATDAETGEPLEATVEVKTDVDGPRTILTHRKTQHQTGRFDWLLPARTNIEVVVWNYEHQAYDNREVELVEGERTVIEANLQPREPETVPFSVQDGITGSSVDASLILITDQGFIETKPRIWSYHLPNGNRSLPLFSRGWWEVWNAIVRAPGYAPTGSLFQIRNMDSVNVKLWRGDIAYNEEFDDNLNWPHNGDDWGITSFGGRSCLTESVAGDYPNDDIVWLEMRDIIHLDSSRATLRIIHLPYCEPNDDYQLIEWWTDPNQQYSQTYSQLRKDWDTLYVPLDTLRGELSLRFSVISDEAIGEDGWLIDQVAVFVEGYDASVSEPPPTPYTLSLTPYPNPFNGMVTIAFGLSSLAPTRIGIYVLDGRLIEELGTGRDAYPPGQHKLVWDASRMAAGVYLVKLESGDQSVVRKVVLMR